MFLHLSVSHSVHRGVSGRADTPQADTPLGRHPRRVNTLSRLPLQRTVRILLQCFLVFYYFPSLYCAFFIQLGYKQILDATMEQYLWNKRKKCLLVSHGEIFALPLVGKVPLTSFTFLTALLHALKSFSKAFPVAPDTILQWHKTWKES